MARDLRGQVTCHAGFSGCDYPLTVQWDGTWLEVNRIIHEWRQPGSKSWQVGTAEGKEFMLSYDESDPGWMVTELVHLDRKKIKRSRCDKHLFIQTGQRA